MYLSGKLEEQLPCMVKVVYSSLGEQKLGKGKYGKKEKKNFPFLLYLNCQKGNVKIISAV
jgi:hypothetical protein